MKKFLILPVLLITFASVAHAQWTEPTLTPPSGNVLAPLRNPITEFLNINNVAVDKKIRFNRTGGNIFSIEQDTNRLYFYNETTSSPLFTLLNNGNVGIGIQSPGTRLTVVSPSINQTLSNFSCAVGGFCQIIVSDGTRTGDLGVSGGSVYVGSNSAHPLQLRTGATTRALIDASGNFGIGTVSPTQLLTVNGTTLTNRLNVIGNGYGLINANIATDNTAGISLHYPSVTAWQLGRRGSSIAIATTGGAVSDAMGTDRLLITNAGNVGIGNSAPAYRLDVAGDINVTGCVRVAGVCTGSGSLAGSGTTNTLAMFTAASTLGDSRLSQQADGSVRTTSPTGYVDVGPKNAGFNHIYTDRPATIFNTGVWAISGIFSAYNTDNLRLQTNGTDRITALASNGNVGIGTNLPTQRLSVAGNINKTGSWILSGNANWGPNALEVYNSNWDGASNNNYGTLAAGHVYSYNGLQSGGATGNEAGDGQLYVAGTSMLMGRVGIGMSNPSYMLQVSGSARVDGDGGGGATVVAVNTNPTTGEGLSATGPVTGVYGYSTNNGWGVRGVGGGASGTGVRGEGYYGVRGQAQNGPPYATYGVYGATEGIYGTGAYGVYCLATSPGSLCGGNKSWTPASDIRLKENVSSLSNPLSKALQLRPVNFEWKSDTLNANNIGFIAQEVKKILPDIVLKGADDFYVLNYDSITAVAIGAIKELNTKVERLEAENDDLKARLERLEAKLK